MEKVKEIEKIVRAWRLADAANDSVIFGDGNVFDKIQGELADALMSMSGEDGSDYQTSDTYRLLESFVLPKDVAEFIVKYGHGEEKQKTEPNLRDCINELCIMKCRTNQRQHGRCDGCRWKKEKDRLYGRA